MGENLSVMETEDRTAARRPRLLRAVLVLAVLGAAVLLSSCAPDPNPVLGTGEDSPGFLMGLWHGIIIFFTFVISLFTDDVSVYEVANDGNWYDFGFVLGAGILFGGGGFGARRRR
jgi:hypothetical protein